MTEGSSQRDRGASLGRDDRIHGSLLIINELIMNSAWSDEVGSQHVMVMVVNSCRVVRDRHLLRPFAPVLLCDAQYTCA